MVCANAWLETSAMIVSAPPMKKLPISVPPSSSPRPPTVTTKNERTR